MINAFGKLIKENKNNLLLSVLIIISLVVAYIMTPSFQEHVDFILEPKIKGAISLTKEKITLKSMSSQTKKLAEQSKNGLKDLCEQSIQTALEQFKVLFPMLRSIEFIWRTVGEKELNQCINRWNRKLNYE